MIPEAGGGGTMEDTEEQRLKNNLAVRRSRLKSRQKMSHMVDRCGKLRKENDILELKVDALTKELAFLKEMFLTHASGKKESPISRAQIERIMNDGIPGPEVPAESVAHAQSDDEDQCRASQLQDGERIWMAGAVSP